MEYVILSLFRLILFTASNDCRRKPHDLMVLSRKSDVFFLDARPLEGLGLGRRIFVFGTGFLDGLDF